MSKKPFRILSIDGGGIRGVFPAKILTEIETMLSSQGVERHRICDQFDLICGTSTGGILAIALALGIPAKDILDLYLNNAQLIFGKKRWLFPTQLFKSAHNRKELELLIRTTLRRDRDEDPRIADCLTSICVPMYNLVRGEPAVMKTGHHTRYKRDFHIPAYQAALGTSAAPTYFDPYSFQYTDLNGNAQSFSNMVDGGVVMNNPTLVGIIEAQKAFGRDLSELQVLSIGTGTQPFVDGRSRNGWGLRYWIGNKKRPVIELFMQGQSQQVQNLVSLLKNGIDKSEDDNFKYLRIDTKLDQTTAVDLDETRPEKLEILVQKAHHEFQENASLLTTRGFIDMGGS